MMKRRAFIKTTCAGYPLLAAGRLEASTTKAMPRLMTREDARYIPVADDTVVHIGAYGRRVAVECQSELIALNAANFNPQDFSDWPHYCDAARHNQQLYLLDRSHLRIDVFSDSGQWLSDITLPDGIQSPRELGFFGDKLWLLDISTQAIWQSDCDHCFSPLIEGLSAPLSVAVVAEQFHILEQGLLQISVWNDSGVKQGSYGKRVLTDGVYSISASNNNVWVLDRFQQRILHYQQGKYMAGLSLSTTAGLSYLATDNNGDLWVTV
ncbi:hypothetical protein [Bacterioplanoides sp.]|uniref:hypothetical protein n=1 Tax=Bacterioplanoides sp. TaxID=2066072 RepID=UPI003B001827